MSCALVHFSMSPAQSQMIDLHPFPLAQLGKKTQFIVGCSNVASPFLARGVKRTLTLAPSSGSPSKRLYALMLTVQGTPRLSFGIRSAILSGSRETLVLFPFTSPLVQVRPTSYPPGGPFQEFGGSHLSKWPSSDSSTVTFLGFSGAVNGAKC